MNYARKMTETYAYCRDELEIIYYLKQNLAKVRGSAVNSS